MIQVFKIRNDGSFDYSDNIITESDSVPDEYGVADGTKMYSETGFPLTAEEFQAIQNQPQSKNEFQLLEEKNADLNLQIIELWEVLISGGVI